MELENKIIINKENEEKIIILNEKVNTLENEIIKIKDANSKKEQ